MGVGKPLRTKSDGVMYPSMGFQFYSISDDSKNWISLKGSYVRVCLVVLNQGCLGSS